MADTAPRGAPSSGPVPRQAAKLAVGGVPNPGLLDYSVEPLPGVVTVQFIRCGKVQCHCRNGNLHGPYHYRVWRGEGRKVHKVYVKKADLFQVQRQCDSHHAFATELRALKATADLLTARIRKEIRRSQRLRQQRDRHKAPPRTRA